MMLMYDTIPMPESKLPPVYIRKEHKRLKMDPSGNRFVNKDYIDCSWLNIFHFKDSNYTFQTSKFFNNRSMLKCWQTVVLIFGSYADAFAQQQPERRKRDMGRQSFLHAHFSKRPACSKFVVRARTRKRTSPSNSRLPLPSPFPHWLNLPWRQDRTTQNGWSVRTGLCFRY